MKTYKATAQYASSDPDSFKQGPSAELTFTAESPAEAVRQAVAWTEAHEQIPEFKRGVIMSVEVSEPIIEDDYYHPGLPIFEWHDTYFLPLHAFAEALVAAAHHEAT